MATTLRETSLHRTAFWILGVTVRNTRQAIVQCASDKSLTLDHDVCQSARSTLTNPRTRLSAEMAWLPGVAPTKAEQLVIRVLKDPLSIQSEPGLPQLARANLLVAAFETAGRLAAPSDAATFLHDTAVLVDELTLDDIRRDINEDRLVSGFPEVGNAQVEEELTGRKRQIRDVLKETLNHLPTVALVTTITESIDRATNGGSSHAPHLLDELVDGYEVEAHEFLQKEAANVTKLVGVARSVAGVDPRALAPIVERLEAVVRNWDRVAQPIQLSAQARGISHQPSNELAYSIRALAVELFNEHSRAAESQRLTSLLQGVFAEIPQVAERAGEDAKVLESIIEKGKKRARADSYRTATEHSSLRVIVGDIPKSSLTDMLTTYLPRIAGAERDVVVVAGWTNEEILRHADEQRPDLFVLILNNMQARVDGAIALSTEIRKRYGVPIIAMAGGPDDPALSARAIKAGAGAFLTMPFSPADLAAAVHAVGIAGGRPSTVRQTQPR